MAQTLRTRLQRWRARNVEQKAAADGVPDVIHALDSAQTSWFHFVVVIVAGMGCASPRTRAPITRAPRC